MTQLWHIINNIGIEVMFGYTARSDHYNCNNCSSPQAAQAHVKKWTETRLLLTFQLLWSQWCRLKQMKEMLIVLQCDKKIDPLSRNRSHTTQQ